MLMADRRGDLHFDVHPSVVFQLGADLISDDVQALIELVKNSYDAEATYVSIEIDTRADVQSLFPDTYFSGARGYVRITDDGLGMDLPTIRSGWLVVSNSAKRLMKTDGSVPAGRRTPLGDKGLGRLGSQRLAANVEIITVAKGSSEEHHVGFSWSNFAQENALHDVPISGPQTRTATRNRGTVVLMSGLLDPTRWQGAPAKEELQDRLAELISPFEAIESFDLAITVDGAKFDVAHVARKLRNEADITFAFDFNRKRLRMDGKVKLRQLEPSGEERQRAFDEHCKRDGGRSLLSTLIAKSDGRPFSIEKAGTAAWFARFQQDIPFEDLDKLALVSHGVVADPGPFRGEVDSFDLSVERSPSAFGGGREFSRYVKRLAAVRVYRDGFGVRVDRDFLKLAKAWTGGKSWYGLKPANTIGFIAITARDNPDLVETTDREGFKQSPHLRNFERLLERFVEFTHETLEFARRETIAFCDRFVEERAELAPNMRPEELAQRIGEHLRQTAEVREKVAAVKKTVGMSAREIKKTADAAGRSLFATTPEAKHAQAALERVQQAINDAEHALEEVASLIEQTPRIRDAHVVLQAQIERFNDRLAQAYETMGLGLTAEALVHEIAVIADGLGERLAEVRRSVKNNPAPDERIRAFIRHVDAAVGALRKQIGHLDPALRYVREKRELIDLETFLNESKQYHESRWREGDLQIDIEKQSKGKFDIEVNRGKLTQIFDNLILNSEYWLREDIRLGRIKKGKIKIELRKPFVWLSDNGRGIDKSVEASLFEPFVTTRRGGRGLGLFIVHEFLQSEGGTINLFRERNSFGRHYAFELDLSGLAHGEGDK